jgi:hypothetical protein
MQGERRAHDSRTGTTASHPGQGAKHIARHGLSAWRSRAYAFFASRKCLWLHGRAAEYARASRFASIWLCVQCWGVPGRHRHPGYRDGRGEKPLLHRRRKHLLRCWVRCRQHRFVQAKSEVKVAFPCHPGCFLQKRHPCLFSCTGVHACFKNKASASFISFLQFG